MDELGGVHMQYGTFESETDTEEVDAGLIELTEQPRNGLPADTQDGVADGSNDAPTPDSIVGVTLHQCARNGDVDTALLFLEALRMYTNPEKLLKKLNAHDKDKLTPMHYAARYNHLNFIKLLVEQGADISPRDAEGLTPLHYASRFTRGAKRRNALHMQKETETDTGTTGLGETVITFLIDSGADVNELDEFGQTPLHYAAMKGNEAEVIELLGFELVLWDAVDIQGESALHMAALHNHGDVCKLLLQSGLTLQLKDYQESTALHVAAAEGNMAIVQILLEAGGPGQSEKMVTDRNIDGDTCLSLAVENGHYDVAKLILQKRGDVNMPNTSGMYPLHLAAKSGDARIVRLLTAHSASIDVVNNEQATPLHKAAQYNHVQCVDLLIDGGADMEKTDRENYTPLLLATIYGHSATVDFLIDKGADVTAVDENDKTCIYLAAEQNKLAALEVLLNHSDVKALINVSDRYDNDPLHVAAMEGFLPIVRLLIKNGAELDSKNDEEQTPLHLAAKFGRTNIVRELVKQDKTSVTDTDETSNTALHLAALDGHAKVVEDLIEMGSDVSARNSKLQIPLACAAAKGWLKTVTVLLDEDSPIDAVDRTKSTSLHLASTFGHNDVVNLLTERGADVELRDADGKNCLDLAIDNNNRDTASAIINSDYWNNALRNHTVEAGRYHSPMRKLIRKMPDVAEEAFNRCMEVNGQLPDNVDYEITFNYEFLDDLYSLLQWQGTDTTSLAEAPTVEGAEDTGYIQAAYDTVKQWSCLGTPLFDNDEDLMKPVDGSVKKNDKPYTSNIDILTVNHPLMIMVTSKREGLLAHPLVNALLKHKWKSFGRPFYYINFFIYAVFLVMVTGYVVGTVPPYMVDKDVAALAGDSYCEKLDASGAKQATFPAIAKYFIILLAIFNIVKEALQLVLARLKYFSWENLIEIFIYIAALLLVIDFSDCQDTGYRHTWQWNLGTLTIFFTWINLMLFMQKFPRFGIYVLMFRHILNTFFQFFLVFVLFIMAFAMAFFTMLQDQDTFDTWWRSLIKTSVMMIGEFDYDSIFTDGDLHPEVLSYLMFVVFMIVMSIIIMNLLVGLAVDNIQDVQKVANLNRKAMQVDLALGVERMLPDCCRRRFTVTREKVRPNTGLQHALSKLLGWQSHGLTDSISQALNPESTEFDALQERVERLQRTVDKVRNDQKTIRSQGAVMEGMLKALMRAQDVQWPDEEFPDVEQVGASDD